MDIKNWDTAMVLTAILAPLCLALFTICIMQWQRINELKHDKEAALAKASEATKQAADDRRKLEDSSAKKDDQINRQQKEIEGLHKRLGIIAIVG